ncbi:hypothetical protein PVK06_046059 [Gossypium arboreum]|uniref:Tr-type G domain-containing protein n=1 Tax=Gossypium arboreum TaxID=29729 RepID=A0ABR0MVS0_GOSAR|nr:hypothetical protein PVK06_046059 [Gossypium arboreum]
MVYTYVYIDIEAELHALRLEHSAGKILCQIRSDELVGLCIISNGLLNFVFTPGLGYKNRKETPLECFVYRSRRYMAHIRDTNEEERAKGITIEVGRAHFETATTRFTILDAPVRTLPLNLLFLLTLVIYARKGEIETGYEKGGQTGEHVILAKTLGVAKLLVVVYTMDDCSVNCYDEIQSKMTPFLRSKGYNVKKGLHTSVGLVSISAHIEASNGDTIA